MHDVALGARVKNVMSMFSIGNGNDCVRYEVALAIRMQNSRMRSFLATRIVCSIYILKCNL